MNADVKTIEAICTLTFLKDTPPSSHVDLKVAGTWGLTYLDKAGEMTHLGKSAWMLAAAMGLCTIMDDMTKKGETTREEFISVFTKQLTDFSIMVAEQNVKRN